MNHHASSLVEQIVCSHCFARSRIPLSSFSAPLKYSSFLTTHQASTLAYFGTFSGSHTTIPGLVFLAQVSRNPNLGSWESIRLV